MHSTLCLHCVVAGRFSTHRPQQTLQIANTNFQFNVFDWQFCDPMDHERGTHTHTRTQTRSRKECINFTSLCARDEAITYDHYYCDTSIIENGIEKCTRETERERLRLQWNTIRHSSTPLWICIFIDFSAQHCFEALIFKWSVFSFHPQVPQYGGERVRRDSRNWFWLLFYRQWLSSGVTLRTSSAMRSPLHCNRANSFRFSLI